MPSPLRTKAEQNALLLQIRRYALAFARGRRKAGEADALAGDVVVYCLESLRAGTWERPKNLQAYIRQLVKARAVDARRRRALIEEFEEECLALEGPLPLEQPSPDCAWTADDIEEFQRRVMKRMPHRVRDAYRRVRLMDASYEEAALGMNVSVVTIHSYIAKAHRLLRRELELVGVRAESYSRSPEAGHRWQRQDDLPFSPHYVQTQKLDGRIRSTSDADRSTGDADHSIDDAGRSIDDGGRSIDDAGRPIDDAGRSIDDAHRSIADAGRPDRDAVCPDGNAGRPDRDAGCPDGNAGRPDRDASRPDGNAGRPDRDASRPDRDASRPDRNAGRSIDDAGRPDHDAGHSDADAVQRKQL